MLTFPRQKFEASLQVHVDSDRMPVIFRRGKHLLRHMWCVQAVVAVSSGEVEHNALFRGACTSLGILVTLPILDGLD